MHETKHLANFESAIRSDNSQSARRRQGKITILSSRVQKRLEELHYNRVHV